MSRGARRVARARQLAGVARADADGVSAEKNLPVKWSPTREHRVEARAAAVERRDAGHLGRHIFLNVAEADGDKLVAVGRQPLEGRRRCGRSRLSGGNNKQRKQNMSSPSPVTDGTTVWVMTGTGFLRAFDFKGNELWMRDIQKDYGRFGLNWGYANSPLLIDGDLIVPVLHGMKTDDPSYVLRIDGKTGKTEWRVERPTKAIRESPDAYITPALVRVGNGDEIVITGGDVVTGHDPATGKELWRADGLNPENNPAYRIVASPVVLRRHRHRADARAPMLVLKAGGRGDVTTSHKLWEFNERPRRADAGHRRHLLLRRQRSRHRLLPRR